MRYGHAVGDEALQMVANIGRKIFEKRSISSLGMRGKKFLDRLLPNIFGPSAPKVAGVSRCILARLRSRPGGTLYT